jgi:hypothetical protein
MKPKRRIEVKLPETNNLELIILSDISAYPKSIHDRFYKEDSVHIFITKIGRTVEDPKTGKMLMYRVLKDGSIIREKCEMKHCPFHKESMK